MKALTCRHIKVAHKQCIRRYGSQSLPTSFPKLTVLNKDPPVYTVDDFLTEQQCDAIVDTAQRHGEVVTTSRTYLLHNNSTSAQSKEVRNSTTWYVDANYPVIEEMCSKVSLLTGHSVSTFEEPQVVRYRPGQYYAWHQDAIPPGKVNAHAGNRLATVLIYLNDVHKGSVHHNELSTNGVQASNLGVLEATNTDGASLGGCTSFKSLDLHVRPKKGKCLIFFPCFYDGTPDSRTVHCSQPIGEGDAEKWVAQIWVHQRPYLF